MNWSHTLRPPSLTWPLKMLCWNPSGSSGFGGQEPPVSLLGPTINLSLLQTPMFRYCLTSPCIWAHKLAFGNIVGILQTPKGWETSNQPKYTRIGVPFRCLRTSCMHTCTCIHTLTYSVRLTAFLSLKGELRHQSLFSVFQSWHIGWEMVFLITISLFGLTHYRKWGKLGVIII